MKTGICGFVIGVLVSTVAVTTSALRTLGKNEDARTMWAEAFED